MLTVVTAKLEEDLAKAVLNVLADYAANTFATSERDCRTSVTTFIARVAVRHTHVDILAADDSLANGLSTCNETRNSTRKTVLLKHFRHDLCSGDRTKRRGRRGLP